MTCMLLKEHFDLLAVVEVDRVKNRVSAVRYVFQANKLPHEIIS